MDAVMRINMQARASHPWPCRHKFVDTGRAVRASGAASGSGEVDGTDAYLASNVRAAFFGLVADETRKRSKVSLHRVWGSEGLHSAAGSGRRGRAWCRSVHG